MLEIFWREVLFRPVFNLLIFLQCNYSLLNMGIAVVLLTIILRVLLAPFSLMSYKGKSFYHDLADKIKEIDKDYGSDYIKKKDMVRTLLRKNHVNPWSQIVVLGVQFLVLILLYQVFIGGINMKDKIQFLYSFIPPPDYINKNFWWFDISKPNWLISTLTGFVLFLEINLTQYIKHDILTKKDQIFKIVFPIFTIVMLGILPSVKSIFILTSIVISIIMILIVDIAFQSMKKSKEKSLKSKPMIDLRDITIKRVK